MRGGPSGQLLGYGLGVAMEEVDLRSQHVGEACSAFIDVVVAAGAPEQFGPRCLAGRFECGGAILSASGTTSRRGTRTEAARRTGRRQEKLSSDRAATRSYHGVPSFGVMSFSPNGPSGVAPMDNSHGLPHESDNEEKKAAP